MRRLGMLGGMAWPSTMDAYRRINEAIGAEVGGVASAPLVIWSFNFARIEKLQAAGQWDRAGALLADAAVQLEGAGAEGLMLCTNTMHKVAPTIESAVDIPLLHIADATAERVTEADVSTVGLLGTRYTMEGDFYAGRLGEHDLDVVVPDAESREEVHRIIYDELVLGDVREESRDRLQSIADGLVAEGAEGVIAGCTEIELCLGPDDLSVPYFPTTAIHVDAAVSWILDA